MASTPNFAATPNNGHVQLNNALGTSLSAAAETGATNGTRVREIRVVSGATTAPGASATKLFVSIEIGGTARRIDVLSLTNAADVLQGRLLYDNLVLLNGNTIKFNVNGALASGATLDCVVFGEDF